MTRSFSLTTLHRRALAGFLGLLLPVSLHAQMGNDNPTGVAGVYNGNVTTGCSYDPYTGSAIRSVTDLSVAGAVGAYPLAFTRTMNSRYTSVQANLEFGASGSWRHSYQWIIEPVVIQSNNAATKWTVMPGAYTVNYPDGRYLSFSAANGDTLFRGGPGISDRFQQLSNPNGGDCFLILPDGGKVWFQAEVDREIVEGTLTVTSTFTFQLVGIIDPYGQLTTVGDLGDGCLTVTEPAGRTLKLYYISTSWNGDVVIDRVVAGDGRTVKYNYGSYQPAGTTIYTALVNVQYLNNDGSSYAQAVYAYQPNNVVSSGRPLISSAVDPMYTGPMGAISYTFVPYSAGGVYGQLQSENYLDPTTGTPGPAVSSLSANGNSRTETRGDGPTRTFNYSGGKLVSYTDFKGQPSSISYDGNGFISGFTDARNKTTTTLREGLLGAISTLTHPDDEHSTQVFTYYSRDGAPYFSHTRQDERGHITTFTRDPNTFQVTRIDYPDSPTGPYEAFTYNGFGEVETHTLTTGGVEHFVYDENVAPPRGLLTSYYPPPTESDPNPQDHPTRYLYYTSGPQKDRVQQVIDPRGNTTSYEYNWRGQVTRVTHQDGSFVQMAYNVDGTLAWTADENHPNAWMDGHDAERTRYTYDQYKRVLTITNPMNEMTTVNYALNWANPLFHTTNNPNYVQLPSGKWTAFQYDENFRNTYQGEALGTDDGAENRFDYDEVGNLTWVRDPRFNVTTFGYDARNRRIWMDDPIASDRNSSGHTMNWEYDSAGNRTKETRADNAFRSWDYDSLNRLWHAIDWRMSASDPAVTTTHDRNTTSRVETITDPKGGVYTFNFDELHRKTSETFPPDVANAPKTEAWVYDIAGNLDHFTNRAGATQQFAPYDNRNRPMSFSWNDCLPGQSGCTHTQGVTFNFDNASRLTGLHNNDADITFGYDDANRKKTETETIKSYGLHQTHTVNYDYDADGNRYQLVYPQGWDYRYSYTNRNQLANITLAGLATPTVQYTYDLAGNRARRTTYYGAYTDYHYNAINQLDTQTSYFNGGTARFDYGFDVNNRIKYEQRDSGAADGFGYDVRNQLTNSNQNGTLDPGGTVSGSYNVTFNYDANGNRTHADESCCIAPYATAPNNQYSSDWTGGLTYDGNSNLTGRAGWSFTYDAQNRLTSIDNGATHIHQHYDPLGRIVARDTNGDITTQVWDNWNLIEEHAADDTFKRMYFHGAATNEIVVSTGPAYGDIIYFQDGRGNVTHLTNSSNTVIEHYTYFVSGQPTFFDGNNTWLPASNKGNRFLFAGAQYVPEAGIYDMRNRFYHPNLGRFMQSDPLGFGGGDANLFRYCRNDPVNWIDPSGLVPQQEVDWDMYPPLSPGALNAIGNGFLTLGGILGAAGSASFNPGLQAVGGIAGLMGFAFKGAALITPPDIAKDWVDPYGPNPSPSPAPAPPSTSSPPAPPQPAPPQPAPPPARGPDGDLHDANGTALPGGEENSVPPGSIPFAFPGYGVVPVENEWDFGSGGGFIIKIRGTVVRVY